MKTKKERQESKLYKLFKIVWTAIVALFGLGLAVCIGAAIIWAVVSFIGLLV